MSNIIKIKEITEFVIKSLHGSKDIENIISNCDKKGMKEIKPLPHIEYLINRRKVTNQNKLLVYGFKTDIVEVCAIYFLFFKNKLFEVELTIPTKKIFFSSNIEKLFQLMHKMLIDKKFEHIKPPQPLPPYKEDSLRGNDFITQLARMFEPYYEEQRKHYEEQRKLESILHNYHLRIPKTHFSIQANLKKFTDGVQLLMFNSTIQNKSTYCFMEDSVNQNDKILDNYYNQLDSLPKKIALAFKYGMAEKTPKIHMIEFRCESCKKKVNHILIQRDDNNENLIFIDLNISSYVRKNIICKKCKNNHAITKNDIVKSMDIKKQSWPIKFDLIKDSIKSLKIRESSK